MGEFKLNELPVVTLTILVAGLIIVLGILILSSMRSTSSISGDCTYTYNNDDATDYFGITTTVNNVTPMSSTELWTAWNYFTPRLNFTRVVNGSIVATNENLTGATQTWLIRDNNCNTTLKVYNSTTLLGAGNYSFIWVNQSNHTWAFKFLTQTYAGEILRWSCNRTFVACKVNMTPGIDCDDLVIANKSIETQYTIETWIAENEPTSYGEDKTFHFEDSFLGDYVNNTNWAVGWNYTSRVCVSSVGNPSANESITASIDALGEFSNNWFSIIVITIAASLIGSIVVVSLWKKLAGNLNR